MRSHWRCMPQCRILGGLQYSFPVFLCSLIIHIRQLQHPEMAYNHPHARQRRVYQPGKRHMELMPSLSRSSGLDKDGDA